MLSWQKNMENYSIKLKTTENYSRNGNVIFQTYESNTLLSLGSKTVRLPQFKTEITFSIKLAL